MTLAYEIYPGETEPVLAIHGISSQRKLWLWLHEAAPEVTLLAPDLRGRGDSLALGGPYAMTQHVTDLGELLDGQGIERCHVVGMSMGGFVAVHLAAAHPDRVASVVLVDGGAPMAAPPGLTPELLPMVFAGRIGRLERSWGSVAEYRDYFCSDIAPLLDRDDPLLLQNLAHDLDAKGRVRLDGEALIGDGAEVFFGPNPYDSLRVPVRFLYAEWSVGAGSPPGYGAEQVELVRRGGVAPILIPGVDHAGSIMSRQGATAVAEELRAALA